MPIVKVSVQTRTDSGYETAEFEVVAEKTKTPGLIVNRTLATRYARGREARWNITHAASGVAVNPRVFPTKKSAVLCAEELGAIGDWTRPVEEVQQQLREDQGFRDGFYRILRGHGGA